MILTDVSVKVLVKVFAIFSKKSIGESIGNTFLMKYRYQYWQYFLKVLLIALLMYKHRNVNDFMVFSHVNSCERVRSCVLTVRQHAS